MISATAFSSLALEASRSRSDQTVRFFAAASKSLRRCQSSGLALLFSVRDPSGKSVGICRAVMARTSALGAMPSILPALNLAWRSLHMAPWTFMMRWRSKTTSSVPTILCGAAVVQAASVAATRGISTRLRRSLARRVMSPPRSWGALPSLDLVLHRGNGLQILCNGLQISLGHVLVAGQGALNRLAHQPARDVAIGPVARPQIGRDLLLRPVAEARGLVGRDVGRGLTFGTRLLGIPREESVVVDGHGHGRARRVALAAVSDGADEILAARHAGHGGSRRWRLLGREGHEPGGQEDALEHGHGDLLRRVLATHGRDRAEKGDHGLEVALGHAVEGREGVNGKDALAVGAPAEPYRRDDLLVRPAADPRGLVGRDVRRVHGPEGPFELLAARVGLALGLGMAAAAARGAEDVFAARDLGRISGEGSAGPPGHEAGREKKSAHGSYPNAKPPSWVPTSFEVILATCRRRQRNPVPRSRAPRMPPRAREKASEHRPAPPSDRRAAPGRHPGHAPRPVGCPPP